MTQKVKLSGTLPAGDVNGITARIDTLKMTDGVHVLVGLVATTRLTVDVDAGEISPTITFRAAEILVGADANTVRDMISRAYATRTGKEELPEISESIAAVLDGDHQQEGEK